MRVSIRKPPVEVLERYYELWLGGADSTTIAESLAREFQNVVKTSSTGREFKAQATAYVTKNLPAFHSYCRLKFTQATTQSLMETGTPAMTPLTDERRAELLHYVAMGAPLSKAADLLNVPLITITEGWFKTDETLQIELSCIRDRHDLRVVAALEKRAVGYEVPWEEVKEIEEDSCGGKVDGSKTGTHKTTGVTHIPGSVEAQKHWTKNRLGWTDNPRGEGTDGVQVEYDVRERLYDE